MARRSESVKTFSDKIHAAFHDEDARSNRIVSTIVWVLILISVVLVVVDLVGKEYSFTLPYLDLIDNVVLVLFAIELVLRVATYRPPTLSFFKYSSARRLRVHLIGRLLYCLQPLNLIDIITVAAVVPALRGLRILRALRLIRTGKVFRYTNPLEGTLRAFRDNALLFGFGFSLLGIGTLLGGIVFYVVEKDYNEDIVVLADGFWWALVSLTTVGYGDVSPVTQIGRMTGAALMISGMFTLALFAGIVGHTLLNTVLSLREEQVRVSAFVNHIVICGYDPNAEMLLGALTEELGVHGKDIMVFAPGERPPSLPPRFMWLNGDPKKESELPKCRLTHADAVIIVGSRAVDPQAADAQTILTAFTLRSFMRKSPERQLRARPLYIVAEILDAENVDHARAAGANEVIETTRLGFSLLAHAVSVHGTAEIMSKVASAGNHNLYVGRIPEGTIFPTTFETLGAKLRREHDALLIGLRNSDTAEDVLNPPESYPILPDTEVIYLATESMEEMEEDHG